MSRYLRRFYCKRCNCTGELDELCSGLVVIECERCNISEVWGKEVEAELDHFQYVDEVLAVVVGGWMN